MILCLKIQKKINKYAMIPWGIFVLSIFMSSPVVAMDLDAYLITIQKEKTIEDKFKKVDELFAQVVNEINRYDSSHGNDTNLISLYALQTFLPMIDPEKIKARECDRLIEDIKFNATGHGKVKDLSCEVVFVLDIVYDMCK